MEYVVRYGGLKPSYFAGWVGDDPATGMPICGATLETTPRFATLTEANRTINAMNPVAGIMCDVEEVDGEPDSRVETALEMARMYGGIEGDHHKAWVIDQMVRTLLGCPMVKAEAKDCYGKPYTYETLGTNEAYERFVASSVEDPEDWDQGIAP